MTALNRPVTRDSSKCSCRFQWQRPIVAFYTTRIVRAESREAAANAAVRAVTAQWSSGSAYAKNNRGSLPRLSVEWVKDDTILGSLLFRGSGHTFYPADQSRSPEGVAD